MVDSSKIQSIAEKLKELGLLASSHPGDTADDVFVDAQDKAVRFLAEVLDMDGVKEYTPDFGRKVLDRLTENEKSGKLAKDIKTIKEHADLSLGEMSWIELGKLTAQNPIGALARDDLRKNLQSAGIPKEQWGQIKLGGLLAFIDDREQVIQNLNDIANDPGVLQVQQARVQQARSATDVVLKAIGQEGKNFDDAAVQDALKTYVTKLQADFGFPQDKSHGDFSAEFSTHLQQKLTGGGVPAGYDQAQLQSVVGALDSLRSAGRYQPPEAPLDIAGATRRVETTLLLLTPKLNAQLEAASGKTDEQIAKLPEGIRDIVGMFKGFMGANILDRRIPEIREADTIFDMRSQASLQGLLMVLGDPMVINTPGEHKWHYTPQKGQHILDNLDKLKEKLATVMSEEDLTEINPMLSKEKVKGLIDALNILDKEGLIAKELFINPDNTVVEIPDFVQVQFQAQIDKHQDDNPDMLRLLDSITREYSGFMSMSQLMPDLEMPPLYDKMKTMTREERLAKFYKDAKAQYAGDEQAFKNDFFILVQTAMTLPYGDPEYRSAYKDNLTAALGTASKVSDPDKAAKVFADQVSDSNTALWKKNEGGPDYVSFLDRQDPVWKPGLENFSVEVNGRTFTARDVAKLYNDYNLVHAHKEFQDRGQSNPADLQKYVVFQADDPENEGEVQTYVAILDVPSMIFSIEKADPEKLQAIYRDPNIVHMDDKVKAMRGGDPALALLISKDGRYKNGGNFANIISNLTGPQVVTLDKMVDDYSQRSGDIHARNKARLDEKAAHALPLSNRIAGARDRENWQGRRDRERQSDRGTAQNSFNRSAVKISDDDIKTLMKFTRQHAINGGAFVGGVNKKLLAALSRHSGHDLPLGNSLQAGTQIRIKGIDMPDGPHKGPLLAYYDKRKQRLRLVEAPADLKDADIRKALLKETYSLDDAEFMGKIRSQYPELYEVVQNNRTGGYGARTHLKDHLEYDDFVGFKADMRRTLNKLNRTAHIINATSNPDGQVKPERRTFLQRMFGGRAVADDDNKIGAPVEDRSTMTECLRENCADITAQTEASKPIPSQESRASQEYRVLGGD